MGKDSDQIILDRFLNRGKFEGNELFLPVETLEDFIEECQKNDLAILRLEGFELGADYILPLPILGDPDEHPGPWKSYREACNNDAVEFIKKIKPQKNLYFAFVVVNEEEWKKL